MLFLSLNALRRWLWDSLELVRESNVIQVYKISPYLCEFGLVAKEEECTDTIFSVVVVVVHDEAITAQSVSGLIFVQKTL